jgi:thiamine kinase-like enzyme
MRTLRRIGSHFVPNVLGEGVLSKLQVASLGGGITNSLLRVTYAAAVPALGTSQRSECSVEAPEVEHAQVVVRVFGGGSELFIDREKELRVLTQLNSMGFGATLLGTFSNGRVEAWLEARSLAEREMAIPEVIPVVAERLADLHACRIDTGEAGPQLWPTIHKWCVFWALQASQPQNPTKTNP